MNEAIRKLTSRKFWLAVAAFLAAFGMGVAGVMPPEWCAVCMAVSAGIYAACEAYVDGASAKANQTVSTTNKNINANTDSTATVNKIIGAEAKKEA